MAQSTGDAVKTLGVKLKGDLHAQFTLVAQLEGLSLADAVIQAVEQYVTAKQSAADFQQRAAAVLDEIEREAQQRRDAIQSLLSGQPAPADEATTKSRTRKTEG
jgi:ribosomal protein L12E/L44/L45/RPP1/RPP2